MKLAINVLSFNRPQYLAQVATSIAANNLKDCDVHLWQDGHANPFSGRTYPIELEQECIRVFKQALPEATIHLATQNFGIGLMYKTIKEFTFNNYVAGLFIEDDLVVSPDYVHINRVLYEQTKDNPQIGMITAYGPDRFISDREQAVRSLELEHGIPSWGYLLTATQYNKRKPLLDQSYWPLVSGIDYKDRDNELIYQQWIKPCGFKVRSTSQDTADTIAMSMVGQVKLSTVTRNAKYIGAVGQHFTAQDYESGYYGKDNIFRYKNLDSLEFRIPDSDRLKDINTAVTELGFA